MIRQEVAVGPSAFADIQVTPRGTAPYFVEVDYGYTPERLIESLRRKYGEPNEATAAASKVVLVIDVNGRKGWPGLEACAPVSRSKSGTNAVSTSWSVDGSV